MINSLIISSDQKNFKKLKNILTQYCPEIFIAGIAKSVSQANHLIYTKHPKLVFIDTHFDNQLAFDFLLNLPSIFFETIFISKDKLLAVEAFNLHASGFLLKPLNPKALINAVQHTSQLINLKQENKTNRKLLSKLADDKKPIDKIVIPTTTGLEFIPINNIIRCEGLQRCTKLFIQNEKKLVSSNNIGVIAKTIISHNFFVPHRSHLVNLNYIKKYDREGNIIMADGASIPLSRRKKQTFLKKVIKVG